MCSKDKTEEAWAIAILIIILLAGMGSLVSYMADAMSKDPLYPETMVQGKSSTSHLGGIEQ